MFKKYPLYKFVLAFSDFILLICSFILAVLLRFHDTPISELLEKPFLISQSLFVLISSFLWIIIFQYFHLYKINLFLSINEQITTIIKALTYGLFGVIFGSFFFKGLEWTNSRATVFFFAIFSFILITFFRVVIFRKLFEVASKHQFLQRKVLIVGTDQTAKKVAVQLTMDTSHGFKVVGFVDDKLSTKTRIFDDLQVVGKTDRLRNLVRRFNVEEIIIAQSEITHQKLLDTIDRAKGTTATVRLASELYNIIPEKVLVERYVGMPVMLMPQHHQNVLLNLYKRIFDVLGTLSALIVLALPLITISLLIKLTSKGSVFYTDKRVGKDGELFTFYKFRTMEENNDDSIHRNFVRKHIQNSGEIDISGIKKITNDPRVTKIGKFLRKTSLDELPQLFNVLRGEMSLVGPRPCLPYELEEYDVWHHRRFSVTPGCTGIWQVAGRSAVGFNDMVVLDLFYIDNMSPLLDIKIMLRTIPVMVFGKGGH